MRREMEFSRWYSMKGRGFSLQWFSPLQPQNQRIVGLMQNRSWMFWGSIWHRTRSTPPTSEGRYWGPRGSCEVPWTAVDHEHNGILLFSFKTSNQKSSRKLDLYGSGRYTAKKKTSIFVSIHQLFFWSGPVWSEAAGDKGPFSHSQLCCLKCKGFLTGTLAPLPHFLQCWDRAAVIADCLSGADFCADDDNNNHSWRRGRVLKRRSRSYSAIKTHIFRDAVGRSRAVDCGAHILLLG